MYGIYEEVSGEEPNTLREFQSKQKAPLCRVYTRARLERLLNTGARLPDVGHACLCVPLVPSTLNILFLILFKNLFSFIWLYI